MQRLGGIAALYCLCLWMAVPSQGREGACAPTLGWTEDMAVAGDGTLWLTATGRDQSPQNWLAAVTPDGELFNYPLPSVMYAGGLATDGDGVWFVADAFALGRIGGVGGEVHLVAFQGLLQGDRT
jgi:hypothetical protein